MITHRENNAKYIIGDIGTAKGDTGPGLGNPNTTAEKKRNPMRIQFLYFFDENKYPYVNTRSVR
jgi:hypothetical protein